MSRRIMFPSARILSTVAAGWLLLTATALASDWTASGDGDYNNAGNWSAGIPNAQGAVADFSTQNYSGDLTITLDGLSPTLGELRFGDTDNAGSPTSWYLLSNNSPVPVITLDNGAAKPVLHVDPLGVTGGGFDDAYIEVDLTGANGFRKTGDGVLTLARDTSTLLGTIELNAGTLRLENNGALGTIMAAHGTTIDMSLQAFGFVDDIQLASGATVNFIGAAGANSVIGGDGFDADDIGIQGDGTQTVNINIAEGRKITARGNWSSGGGVAQVNITGAGSDIASFEGDRNNGGFSRDAFANANLNLNNTAFFYQLYSNDSQNDLSIGSLGGDATGELRGSDAGSRAQYRIGGNNQNADFPGIVNGVFGDSDQGSGDLAINKVGTGTQTFSGSFMNTEGDQIWVSEGTLAFSGTVTTIPGGVDAQTPTTVSVKAGATLDLSGANSPFTTQANTKLQVEAGGSIVGPLNHGGGELRPGDVDPSGAPSRGSTPTAGTLPITGDLEVSGGTIVFDMDSTPAGNNDLITVSGETTLTSGLVKTNFLGSAPAAGQTYTVLTTNTFSGGIGAMTVDLPGRAPDPSLVINGNALQFTTPTPVSASLVWTGSSNSTWDVETSQNWTNGGSPDLYFEGDAVEFGNGPTNTAITIDGTVSPASVAVTSNSGTDYSIVAGSISGAGTTLTKSGTSTLTIETSQSYGGGTTISGGIVDISDPGDVGSGAVTLNGGAFHVGGEFNNTVQNDFVVSGAGNAIANNSTGASSLRLQGDFSGSGAVTLENNSGDGTNGIDIEGDNSGFTGSITLGGTDAVFTRLRGNTNTAGTNVAWDLGNNGSVLGTVEIEPTAAITLGSLSGGAASNLRGHASGGGLSDVTYTIGTLDTSTTFEGTITDGNNGTTAIVKVGDGTLTLTGANTYTGDTSVLDGTLSITSDYLADGSDIFLATGSILDLDFGAATIDDIDSLFIDGVGQATGIWGSLGSGAQNESSLITGDGLLRVATLGAIDSDFDGDGDTDGLDFLFWQRNDGTPAGLAVWEAGYPNSPLQAASAAVPEPSAVVLGLVAGLLCSQVRRRAA